MSSSGDAALEYHEPSIETILTQASFLILLNVLNWALDAVLYCGLLGQILIGIAWGAPGGQLLSREVQTVVVQLGYLGLILLVYEGGTLTSFPSLKANLALSTVVATTGIALPIALSFILAPLAHASPLQCFAAGAALCSTSLGTTLAVLRASGLSATRLGVVLTSAAMLDDVVGLVMVQVISNLGGEAGGEVSDVTVVRPVGVSVAFGVGAVVVCWLVVRPVTVVLNAKRAAHPGGRLDVLLRQRETALVMHTALLVALVAASSYAGTSNLLAAYIAGATVSWWDSEVPHVEKAGKQRRGPEPIGTAGSTAGETEGVTAGLSPTDEGTASQIDVSGAALFEHHYHPALKWVLQPLFFASIGFSIPITQMFTGSLVWKGVVYSVLMAIAKLLCGIWLVRVPGILFWVKAMVKHHTMAKHRTEDSSSDSTELDRTTQASHDAQTKPTSTAPSGSTSPPDTNIHNKTTSPAETAPSLPATRQPSPTEARNSLPYPPRPLSLYPSAILGLAMVPRGEIGFLISAVAQSNGIFGSAENPGESDIFLIATWAIVLCTVVGPLCVGLLVRRVKRLQDKATSSVRQDGDAATRHVLGVWGV